MSEEQPRVVTDIRDAPLSVDEAIAAVPTSLVEKVALVGPKAKIADELGAWSDSLVTTLLVGGDPEQLATMAELVGIAPRDASA